MLSRSPSGISPEEQAPDSWQPAARAWGEAAPAWLELLDGPRPDGAPRAARIGGFIWAPGAPPLWSDGLYTLLGYQPGSVRPSAEAFLALVHPDDLERVRAAARCAEDGGFGELEYRILHPSGETRHVRTAARVFRENGRIREVIGLLEDVTEARRAAVALEEAVESARAAERSAGIGSFVVRIAPMEMVWTEGLKQLTGVEEPMADAATHLERVHPDDRDKQRRWWDRLVHERSAEPLSVRMMKADGSIRHLYTEAAIARLSDGVERVIGTMLDVTERVQLEDQLRHAVKMEAIGTLAAGVAHDFNNYLLVMDSSLSMLAESDDVEERAELVENGHLALSRCMELTRQLLAFARREPFRPEPADLTEIVGRFQELLRSAVGRRARLCLEAGTEPLLAQVDPRHVERMLTNLVVNAADAIEQLGIRVGCITVRTEAVTLATPRHATPSDIPAGDYVCVAVEDNGGGIAPERLPHIFDPYFTTKPEGRGTGLGLASVYGMARQNDGLVSVGELPGGTRFTLWFPRLGMASSDGVDATLAASEADATQPEYVDADLLIVEDVEPVRQLAARILTSAGYRTLTAGDGREALNLLEHGHEVRVILSDLQMPGMDGWELAAELSRRSNAPPLIFMTGVSEDPVSGTPLPGGAVLAKPFTPERLIGFVRSALAAVG